MVNVSFLDATQFAKWADKRLPSRQEWEKAARGGDGRVFPWGNDADDRRVNVGTKSVQPVTAFGSGVSPFGALNMVGNVWEWVNDLKEPDDAAVQGFRASGLLRPPATKKDPWYTIRGLSYEQPTEKIKQGLVDSATVPARVELPALGFRCVKDPLQAAGK